MVKIGEWIEKEDGLFLKRGSCEDRVRSYDVTLAAERIYPGKKHPYQRLIDKMREIMLEMGFTEIKGEIIQSSFWNFDALFQPQDHPAREMQDTFYLDSKAEIPDFTKVKEMHECGGSVGSTGWGGCWSPEVARQEVLRTHTTCCHHPLSSRSSAAARQGFRHRQGIPPRGDRCNPHAGVRAA